MLKFSIPYGKGRASFSLPNCFAPEIIAPPSAPAAPDPLGAVEAALSAPVGVNLEGFRGVRSAAIAISDETRPVPHEYLLPPLLRRLGARGLGLPPEAITFIIASGTHPPMGPEVYARVVPKDILARYPVACHDADDQKNLLHLGTTSRGVPVWANRRFVEADLRIVVGNVEPHQFQGFSGGVKGAAIGLAGRETVNHNHAMMTDPRARLGRYDDNPARQDVEEIGRLMGVHFALNAVLNFEEKKEIVRVVAGEPVAVMEAAIPLSRQVCQTMVAAPFDLIVASPGGHPKDINVYQAQKALAHAGLVTRDGGTVVLAAACPGGSGSRGYEDWVRGVQSCERVLTRFRREGFRVGPHKAFQIARDAVRVRVLLVSEMAPDLVRYLLLTPASSVDEALAVALGDLPAGARVGIMPQAGSTIPCVRALAGS